MAKKKLTEKQTEVYQAIQRGEDVGVLAERMDVSKAAIYGHLRKIKEAGHSLPAKFNNVGAGQGRGRPSGSGTNGARARTAPVKPPTAVVPPEPTPAPAPVEPTPAAATLDVTVFERLRNQIAADMQAVEVRRGEIKADIEDLNTRLATLQDEDASLEVALARLAGTDKAIDATPEAASANGTGGTVPDLTGAKA